MGMVLLIVTDLNDTALCGILTDLKTLNRGILPQLSGLSPVLVSTRELLCNTAGLSDG